MIWLARFLAIILVATLMVSFWPTLGGRIPLPNLILIGIFYLLTRRKFSQALSWALVGGFILDMSLPGKGIYTLTFAVITSLGYVVFSRYIPRPQVLSDFWLILLGSVGLVAAEQAIGNDWSIAAGGASVASNLLGFIIVLTFTKLFLPRRKQVLNI